MTPVCSLCNSASVECQTRPGERRRYDVCNSCNFVALQPGCRIGPDEEKQRYLTHNNDIHDLGYQNFVRPLVDEIAKAFTTSARGLDFGSGTGPVVTHLLRQLGYKMNLYDPFFAPDRPQREDDFDFVVSCEVIEHLFRPLDEFQQLTAWLKPGGSLFLMTDLWDGRDLFSWYYAKDPTHVCFYSKKNLKWLGQTCGYREVDILSHRLIVFREKLDP